MKHEYSEHHAVPQSRGNYDKKVLLPKKFHQLWHALFNNLYDIEIENFIMDINWRMKTKQKITAEEIEDLKTKIKKGEHYLRR